MPLELRTIEYHLSTGCRAAPGPAAARRAVGTRLRAAPAPGGSPHTVSLIGPGPDSDPEYAMGTDLDEPMIIATTSAAGESAGPVLIDGCYRCTRPPGSAASTCRRSCSPPPRPRPSGRTRPRPGPAGWRNGGPAMITVASGTT
jgi:hypothetical protein